MNPLRFARWLVIIGAWGLGGAVAFTLFPKLQMSNYPSSDLDLVRYPLFVADGAVSLLAGVLAGYLFYFCLWECLAKAMTHWFQRRR